MSIERKRRGTNVVVSEKPLSPEAASQASPARKIRAVDTRTWRRTNIVLLLCPLLLFGFVVKGSSTAPEDATNLYRIAFIAFLESRAAQSKNIENFDSFNVRVQRDDALTESLPSETGRFRIEYLDPAAIEKQYQQRKKPVAVVVVRAMSNEGDTTLIVRFMEYQVSVRGNRIEMALEGGAVVRLVHDCEARKFVVAKVELWGV